MLHQVTRAVAPADPLPAVLADWAAIVRGLLDRPRRRLNQVQRLFGN